VQLLICFECSNLYVKDPSGRVESLNMRDSAREHFDERLRAHGVSPMEVPVRQEPR
jgi:hypothetical protein